MTSPTASSPLVSNIYQSSWTFLWGCQDTSDLEAGMRGGLLSWSRLLNYLWGFAHLPLNQRSLTGDRSKSWIGGCSLSAPSTVCVTVGNYLSHLDHFWYLSLSNLTVICFGILLRENCVNWGHRRKNAGTKRSACS